MAMLQAMPPMAMAVQFKPRKRPPRPVRGYWREACPEDVISWRGRQAYLLGVLRAYDIEGACLVRDLGWGKGWEICVGFPTFLAGREWWRRECLDGDERLPDEPQL